MTINETIDYLIATKEDEIEGLDWEIHKQSLLENSDTLPNLKEDLEVSIKILNNLQIIECKLDRLRRYDEELTKAMPEDYKDWHQNSKEEWPLIARLRIEDLKKDAELAWEQVELAHERLKREYN